MKEKPLRFRLIDPLVEPYARYVHANLLHAIRIGVAIIIAFWFNHLTGVPHGEWTGITVFIILGLLQYQGAIYAKAKERILGTLLGIVVGISLLWLSQNVLSIVWIYYLVIGVISGIIGYYSIKQLGYIGLLTGITMCMIVASQDGMGTDGISRVINVLAGTIISVIVTVILPLKSTLMWRFLLANNLEALANIYDDVKEHVDDYKVKKTKPTTQTGMPFRSTSSTLASSDIDADDEPQSFFESTDTQAQNQKRVDFNTSTVTSIGDLPETGEISAVDKQMLEQFKKINKRLLRVRGHIEATARESNIDLATLDKIQRTHRNIIGTVDLLLTATPQLALVPIDKENKILIEHYQSELTQAMWHMAAVLRTPKDEVLRPITRIQLSEYKSIKNVAFEWQGYFWLTQTLQSQLQNLSDLLMENQNKWYPASGIRYQRKETRRMKAHGGEGNMDI